MKKRDFKISLDRNALNINLENQNESSEENKRYAKREFSYSSFFRSFTLPEKVDHNRIEASYENGIIKVDINKKEEANMASVYIALK